MRFVPSFELKLINENDYENEISKITEEICKIRGSGKFSAFDKTEIYYEYFLAENCKGSIVIVHGLSEFINKFYEFIFLSKNQFTSSSS
jgi:hypothetical protein